MEGALFLASSNISRTREAPTPTNISTKSDPDIEKKGTPASPATAFANNVLPVPGAPTKSMPLGTLAPNLEYLSGFFKNSTTSSNSAFSSSAPATSPKLTSLSSGLLSFALLRPKFIVLRPSPPCLLKVNQIKKAIPPTKRTIMIILRML